MQRQLGSENENGGIEEGCQCANSLEHCPQNQMTCAEGAYDENALDTIDQTAGGEQQLCGVAQGCQTDFQQHNGSNSVKYCTRKVTPPHKRQCLCRKLGKLESCKLREK